MEWKSLNVIREDFLRFFESKDHLRMKSFPLVPENDASLLLVNSGMAPLKPYFTGEETPPAKRMTTCQKCIRTPDIERVGKTSRHGTFFEMLGNFSFGDYFKHEACPWAWEFCTEWMKLPVDRLFVSVFHDDDEAYDIWVNEVGVDPSRMVRLGREDNFWEIGTGPCGPCSEIYFDRGEEYGCGKEGCFPGCDCDRYVEFWNLVFTQFDSDGEGNYTPLEHPNIDTGMGLERLACIMQGVDNLFEVDTIRKICDRAADMAGVEYGKDGWTDVALRVITDHIRSTVFMISDGVLPSNEDRGYVLRRLLRRAARFGRLLGIKSGFLTELSDTVIGESSEAYPELSDKKDYIRKVISLEEERFDRTIDQGMATLADLMEKFRDIPHGNRRIFPGGEAFKLYDTYGFPLDLTKEVLSENGFEVDEDEFMRLMSEQRERARSARSRLVESVGWSEGILAELIREIRTRFTGDDSLSGTSKILAIVKDGEAVDGAQAGEEVTVIVGDTPFYAESGGQVGDTGEITKAGGIIRVVDCQKTHDGKHMHIAKVESGSFMTGDEVLLAVDRERRLAIMRNHTAAHLLQAALKQVLGNHVEQAGSLVDPDRVRFDFSHFAALTEEEIREVERLVNSWIMDAIPVSAREMPIGDARGLGAIALFGEKYGDIVRVISVEEVSAELCGGTHAKNTGNLGLFRIVSEVSVAAGVRRIEGTTGWGVLKVAEEYEYRLKKVASFLKTSVGDVTTRAYSLMEDIRAARNEISGMKEKLAAGQTGGIMDSGIDIGGLTVATAVIDGADGGELRRQGDVIKDRYPSGVAVIAGKKDGNVTILAVAGKDAVAKGISAGDLIRDVAAITGGKGGGRADSAMAGCKDPSKLGEALAAVPDLVKSMLE